MQADANKYNPSTYTQILCLSIILSYSILSAHSQVLLTQPHDLKATVTSYFKDQGVT